MRISKYALLLSLGLASAVSADAQFYNGHQMQFGKNRVQYLQFEWMYYRYPKFDTYFYSQGRDIAQYASDRALEIIPEMEKYFGKQLQRRIIFVVYNRITEFRQSNIGLETENLNSNLGGVTKIIDNKVFLYFEGDHNKLCNQIREAVASIMLSTAVNGTGIKTKVSTSAQIQLPLWISKGLPLYAAESWNAEIEDILRDGFLSGRYDKLNHLQVDDAKYAGYSMWYYINRVYGRDAIPGILYITSINKNLTNSFKQVINRDFKELNKEWREYYIQKFSGSKSQPLPDSTDMLEKPRRNTVYLRPTTSPDGKYTAYISNKMGKYKIWLRDNEDGGAEKLIRRENRLEQIPDYQCPAMTWHPTSKVLSYVIDEQGFPYLYQHNISTGDIRRRMLPKFDRVYSMSYSDDGLNLVMSVHIDGVTDLVVYNVGSGAFDRITQDLADDIDPKFAENSSKIVFASNRISDTLRTEKVGRHNPIQKCYDLFEYDYKNQSPVLKRITNTPYENETAPEQLAPNRFTYLSDKNGVNNRYASVYDSTIIAIDTVVHYAYSNGLKPVTDYSGSILSLQYNSKNGNVDEAFRYNGRYKVFRENALKGSKQLPEVLQPTFFRSIVDKRQFKLDSIAEVQRIKAEIERRRTDSIVANPPKDWIHPDSLKYDFLHYTFEMEKSLAHQLVYYNEDIKLRHKQAEAERPKQRLYFTTFYTDYMLAQVDFSSLNQSYQPFTTGPYYFNSNGNAFFRVGIKDLFEDYRLSAAFRIGGSFDSYEYYFTFEDLKKRLDKQYIFHRYSYVNDNDSYDWLKVITNEALVTCSYPFNQVSALRGTAGLRYDKSQVLIIDSPSLERNRQYQVFAKAMLEYNFDNTISLGSNTPWGTRFKAWTELYQQVEGNYDIISSWGFDFRWYQKLHRCMIFASRVAGATSFGSGKILYYLGGVDNWTMFSSDQSKMFDQSIRIDQKENYIYQAVGTNMRGFIQNCRNGNSFAVINNELRLPLFRYLFNRPLNSKVINDFQLIGFFDAGSAWTGFIPKEMDNAYNKFDVTDGPIQMVIDVARPTVVAGYGFGFRTSVLGYFMRFDWAWGIEGHVVLPKTFYFSLGWDF